jgi:transcription initiation factor TFIIB
MPDITKVPASQDKNIQKKYEESFVDFTPQCTYCNSQNVIEDHAQGSLICTNCGTVVQDHVIDLDLETRRFQDDEVDNSRVGSSVDPLLDGIDHLTTVISATPGSKGGDIARAHLKQTINSADTALKEAFRRIDHMAEKIDLLDKYRGRAKEIYKNLHDIKALKGKDQDTMIAACLYVGCRLENVARSLKEFAVISHKNKTEIGKYLKFIQKKLKLNMETVSAKNYMTRFCSHLKLPAWIETGAEEVASKATEMGIVAGKSPDTVAAAAIYMVCMSSDRKKSMKDVSEVTGVTETTIRNCLKDLEAYRNQLLPKRFLDYANANGVGNM